MEKVIDFKDMEVYRTSCQCGARDCNIDIVLEYEKEYNHVSIGFETTFSAIIWSKYGEFCGRLKHWGERIKKSFRLLFTGYIEMEADFILRDKEQAREIAKVLTSIADEMEVRNKEVG